MKIIAIKRQKGSGGNRIRVYLDDTTLSLSAEVVTRAGLRVGAEIGEADLVSIQASEEAWRCKESALRLLAHRPRSQREMRDRLLRRKIAPAAIDACIVELTRANLLDDDAFGVAFALDRLRSRPVGRSRMLAELRAKGLDSRQAETAVRKAFEEVGVPELDLARRAARKFRRRPGEELARARRRLFGLLARRGFGSETAMVVLEEELGE